MPQSTQFAAPSDHAREADPGTVNSNSKKIKKFLLKHLITVFTGKNF